jgi:hypothetical protein
MAIFFVFLLLCLRKKNAEWNLRQVFFVQQCADNFFARLSKKEETVVPSSMNFPVKAFTPCLGNVRSGGIRHRGLLVATQTEDQWTRFYKKTLEWRVQRSKKVFEIILETRAEKGIHIMYVHNWLAGWPDWVKFRPLCVCLLWKVFLKITEVHTSPFCMLFHTVKFMYQFRCLGYTLGDFVTNASGHPARGFVSHWLAAHRLEKRAASLCKAIKGFEPRSNNILATASRFRLHRMNRG